MNCFKFKFSRNFALLRIFGRQQRLGDVVVRAPDSRSADRGFDSPPRHCRATTLGKLFTPMCLCLPSSISWYLARAFMSTRRMWQPWYGSNEQGEYCSKRFSSDLDRLEPLYKLSTLLCFCFKRMKIDPHCQRRNCCALKVLFNNV